MEDIFELTSEQFVGKMKTSLETARQIQTIGEGNLKIVSDMDPEILRTVFRLTPLKKPDEGPVEAIRREVKDYMSKNPDGQIYIMDDPGLYVVVE